MLLAIIHRSLGQIALREGDVARAAECFAQDLRHTRVIRESVGVWVILFLVVFTFLAWLLKHEYWKDIH